MPRKKHKLAGDKIPLYEKTLRWLDILTYFDYPESIRWKAYEIATNSKYIKESKHDRPSVMAAACLYIADGRRWKPKSSHYWKYEKVRKIVYAKRLKPNKDNRWDNKLMADRYFDANIRLDIIIERSDKIENNKQD